MSCVVFFRHSVLKSELFRIVFCEFRLVDF